MEGESKWYAIYTHSRAEKKVFERLKVAGYDAFLPLVTTIKQWSDRKKKVEVPLINSFVFINTNNDKLNETLSIPGVVTVLKYLGKPAVVKNEEIENLKILVNSNEDFQKIESINLEKGEDIVVTKGPFMGLFAKYIQCSGKHKVIVEVEAIKSFFEVTIPLSHISKINS